MNRRIKLCIAPVLCLIVFVSLQEVSAFQQDFNEVFKLDGKLEKSFQVQNLDF